MEEENTQTSEETTETGEETQTEEVATKETADETQESSEETVDWKGKFTDSARGVQELLVKNKNLETELTEAKKPAEVAKDDTPAYLKDGEWKPKDYKELQDALKDAREGGIKAIEKREEVKAEGEKQLNKFYEDTKAVDKEFDKEDFSKYAIKHGFPINTPDDLKSVYNAYKELRGTFKAGQDTASKNKEERGKDTVANKGGVNSKGTPIDFKTIQGMSMDDLVDKALGR